MHEVKIFLFKLLSLCNKLWYLETDHSEFTSFVKIYMQLGEKLIVGNPPCERRIGCRNLLIFYVKRVISLNYVGFLSSIYLYPTHLLCRVNIFVLFFSVLNRAYFLRVWLFLGFSLLKNLLIKKKLRSTLNKPVILKVNKKTIFI